MPRNRPSYRCVTALALACTVPWLAACAGDRLELAGVVERTSLELVAPESEEVAELPLPVGSRVVADDVVVRLRSEVAQLELEATEALHSAAEASLAAAQREFDRTAGLRRAGVSTASAFDAAQKVRDEAVGLVAERAARRAQAQRHLEDLTLRSTTAGVVDQLPYEIGERVPAGGVAAVILADEAPWVRVWLPARAVSRLAPGTEAQVEVEGLDEPLTGRLGEIAREASFTPHYALTEKERANLVYEAKVVLEKAPRDLRPGLPANVRVRLGAAGAAAGGG